MNVKWLIAAVAMAVLAVYVTRSFSGTMQETNQMSEGNRQSAETTPAFSASGYNLGPIEQKRIGELAKALSTEERNVLLDEGTERAFTGALVKNKEKGIYTCRLCGLPVYDSDAKFQSGTGWPSFFQPIDPDHVREVRDTKHGMVRTEVECARCRSHLGHAFDDGPQPTGLRYCMNSAALKFYPAGAELPTESKPAESETAYFAGGCFWGIEDQFQQVQGVITAVSGYQGGHVQNPDYKQVCAGTTGHAETVRVKFDPEQVSYRELLDWFFKFHNPTHLNRQGPDIGTQYRSAIYAASDKQLAQAKAFTQDQQASKKFQGRKITTEVKMAGPFFEAEEYHQDYHAKHGGSCSINAPD